MIDLKASIEEKFLRYVAIDTQSMHHSDTYPSTAKQLDLTRLLQAELTSLGIKDAEIDEYGYLFATLPSNIEEKVPTVGFIAHVDTSPAYTGKDVKPKKIKGYAGGDIVLNQDLGIVIKAEEYPLLENFIGKDIITTDGTTLLGADDKAGLANIMAAVEYLINHPEIAHGDIRIAFTPDEEIGLGTKYFDVDKFGCDYGYTMDGGVEGSICYETFNACKAEIEITGYSVHPGFAKNKLKNAVTIMAEFISLFPKNEAPESVEGMEGYYFFDNISANVMKATTTLMIRDFDYDGFDQRKEFLARAAGFINGKYGEDVVKYQLIPSYNNMKIKIQEHIHVVDIAKEAITALGLTPIEVSHRGGSDGAKLSFKGLPCPNFFSGGAFAHAAEEVAVIDEMNSSANVVIKIAELNARKQ